MRRDNKKKKKFKFESLGNGFYLYSGEVNPKEFKKSRDGLLIPEKPVSGREKLAGYATDFIKSPSLWSYLTDISLRIPCLILEGVEHGGPKSYVQSGPLKDNHAKEMGVLSTKAYSPPPSKPHGIKFDKFGRIGSGTVEYRASLGMPTHDIADVYVVSTTRPSLVQRHQDISTINSFIFFSKKDAENFYGHLKQAVEEGELTDVVRSTPPIFSFNVDLDENDRAALIRNKELCENLLRDFKSADSAQDILTLQTVAAIKLYLSVLISKTNRILDSKPSRIDLAVYNEFLSHLTHSIQKHMVIAHALNFTQKPLAEITANFMNDLSQVALSHHENLFSGMGGEDLEWISQLLEKESQTLEDTLEEIESEDKKPNPNALFAKTEAAQAKASKDKEKGKEKEDPDYYRKKGK